MNLEATVSIRDVERALDRVGRFGKDLTGIHKALRPTLMRDQKRHRQQQTGPDGQWRPLSPFTIERNKARARAKGKRRSRKVLGKLPTAFKVFVDSKSLRLESRVSWSLAHQEGTTSAGRAPEIPKREFFWLSTEAMRDFVALIEENAGKTWMGMHL